MKDKADELFQIYRALQAHGIYIDQVDMDDNGHLYRWIVKRGVYSRTSVERWRNPGDALNAALDYLFSD